MPYVIHPLQPVFDVNSRVLILGSMPSPASREAGFYYAHPRNRFFPVLSELLQQPLPQNTAQRIELLQTHHIALWDVIHSCRIEGARDETIRDVTVNPIGELLRQGDICAVFTCGAAAGRLYRQHCLADTGMPAIALPSTSPANAAWSLPRLCQAYRVILPYLQE